MTTTPNSGSDRETTKYRAHRTEYATHRVHCVLFGYISVITKQQQQQQQHTAWILIVGTVCIGGVSLCYFEDGALYVNDETGIRFDSVCVEWIRFYKKVFVCVGEREKTQAARMGMVTKLAKQTHTTSTKVLVYMWCTSTERERAWAFEPARREPNHVINEWTTFSYVAKFVRDDLACASSYSPHIEVRVYYPHCSSSNCYGRAHHRISLWCFVCVCVCLSSFNSFGFCFGLLSVVYRMRVYIRCTVCVRSAKRWDIYSFSWIQFRAAYFLMFSWYLFWSACSHLVLDIIHFSVAQYIFCVHNLMTISKFWFL